MKCFSRAATVMAAIVLLLATIASATIVVETNGDNRMRNSVPASNWGTLTSMDIVPPGNNTTHGLVAFDNLPALTGAQVASATLRLQAWLGTGHTIEARAVGPLGDPNDPNDGWTELGSSWNNYKPGWAWPNGPGGLGDAPVVADSLTITATDTLYDWDVTTEVKAWLDGNAENNGFLLNAAPGTNTGSDNRLATREDAVNGNQPPRLIIEENLLPPATVFTWEADDVGNWANSDSWSFAGAASQGANSPNHTAIFGGAISTDTTAVTNAHVTVNRIEFANSTQSYNIAGHGSVNLAAATNSSSSLNPTMTVLGNHEVQAAVNLRANASVDVATASTLTFNNALDLMGNTLTKIGVGMVMINNRLTTSGGTVSVQKGTVSGGGIIGGNVNNDGGNVAPGNSPGILEVTGNYNQGSGGTLAIEITGTAGVGEGGHDQLKLGGDASLDGTLDISVNSGGGSYSDPATPGDSDTFVFLTAGTRTGTFATVEYDGSSLTADFGPDGDGSFRDHVGGGLFRNVTYTATTVDFRNLNALEGDADGNKTVDITDFQRFLIGFTGATADWTTGDFNLDNVVDITDFSNDFLPNFAVTGGGTYGPGQSIPEPSALLLLGLGGVLLGYISHTFNKRGE